MGIYNEKEQDRLTAEYRQKIKEAYETYRENIEEIYSYGCREEETKEAFIDECKIVLYPELCQECHKNEME